MVQLLWPAPQSEQYGTNFWGTNMANMTTSADLKDQILFNLGEPVDGSSDFDAEALIQLNRAYRELWSGGGGIAPEINETWDWLKQHPPGVLTLDTVLDEGTIAVTKGSISITFSNAPVLTKVNWHIKIDNESEIYRILTHTAGQATATLDSEVVSDTGTFKYKAYHLEYDLTGGIMKLVSPFRRYDSPNIVIPLIDSRKFDLLFPLQRLQTGVPQVATIIQKLKTGNIKVRFSHGGNLSSGNKIRLEYDCSVQPIDLLDDSAEPLVPKRHRKILSDIGTYYLLLSMGSTKADDYFKLGVLGLRGMALENRKDKVDQEINYGEISPRLDNDFSHNLQSSSGFLL